MNIYEKMSLITEAIKKVPKNLSVGFGKYSYKAVAEADILAAVKDAEKQYGIFSYPADSKVVESRSLSQGEDSGKKDSMFVRIERTYRFVNVEEPDEFLEVKGYGDGIDSNDKAPGKAITYADKYCLMKAYKIETGDELDAVHSDDIELHDAGKIKLRLERLLTAKMQQGKDVDAICAAMGLNRKQFDSVMQYPAKLVSFEAQIKAL